MATKTRSSYVCQQCGAIFAKWSGRCVECGEWNSIVEEIVVEKGENSRFTIQENSRPIPVTDAEQESPERKSSGIAECDRVLGGGIVPGSLTLIGGDPGIGKSTLMMQISHHIAKSHGAVLYVSGEESFNQSRLRAGRLDTLHDDLYLLTETSVSAIRSHIASRPYSFVVIDSIQSVHSSMLTAAPGSVSQVRECANEFMLIAKGKNIPVFLIGHVTKDGAIAGPRLLEHMVDTVLYFEGEGKHTLRILRAVKNRFGSTNEIGVFEMTGTGLCEVSDPSALFLHERPEGISGSVVFPSIEGTRPVLVEVQALVSETSFSSPKRTVTGVNPNRVSLLLAVLEKRCGLHFSDRDVFVNVAGGVRLDEPAADVAIALALASSLRDVPVASSLVVFGEVGLAGEIREVGMTRQRVAEAAKFGFAKCVLPESCAKDVEDEIGVYAVSDVAGAIEMSMEI